MLRLTYLIFLTTVLGNINFNINIKNKMIVRLVKATEINGNHKFDSSYIEPAMNQSMVYAYYPIIKAPKGTYRVYIIYWKETENVQVRHQIGEIKYNGNDVGKWIVNKKSRFYNLNSKGQGIPSFELYTKYIMGSGDGNTIPIDANEYSNQWRFVLYFKTRDEKFEGNIEDPNLYDKPTDEFCQSWVYTTGEDKTLGAICPIDPAKDKRMDLCLNWRRADIIGKICNSHLSNEKRDSSIITFCNEKNSAEDCRCINRNLQPDFKENKEKHVEDHDYCWYEPCNSGNYLIQKDVKGIVSCNKCIINDSEKTILRNNYIKCVENAENPDDKKKCMEELLQKIHLIRFIYSSV